MKKLLSLLLVLTLVLGFGFVKAEEESSEEFTSIARAPKNDYIPVTIDGFDGTLYAFVNKDGEAQLRAYGKVGNKKGFFPLTIEDGEITIADTVPLNEKAASFGKAKVATEATDIPEGFAKTGKKNIFYMLNLFGEKEHVIYASYDGENYAFYPLAKGNVPQPGSLPYDLDSMLERSKKEVGKKVKKPNGVKAPYSTGIIINLNGEEIKGVSKYTDIDVEDLLSNTSSKKSTKSYVPSASSGKGSSSGSSKGDASIRKYQSLLKNLGYYNSDIDGKLGNLTKNAILAYQKNNGLQQTGQFDSATVAKLGGANHIDARGKYKSNASVEISKDTAKAEGGVTGATANITLRYKNMALGEGNFVSVKFQNPNNLPGIKVICEVRDSNDNRVAYTTADNGDIRFEIAGNKLNVGVYKVATYLQTSAGIVGRDYKTFSVSEKVGAYDSNDPDSATRLKNDAYFTGVSIQASATKVTKGTNVTFTVTAQGQFDPSYVYDCSIQYGTTASYTNTMGSNHQLSTNYTFPENGVYNVTATVESRNTHVKKSANIQITVGDPQAPAPAPTTENSTTTLP